MKVAPYVPSAPEAIRKMLEIAEAGPDDVLYDLGCGDGRILIVAVKEFGVKKAIGIEIRRDLVRKALENVRRMNLTDKIEIIRKDFFYVDISPATVVTLYLSYTGNIKLKEKLKRELKKGTRVVSHDFEIPGWSPVKQVRAGLHDIYLYVT